jgi:HYDIN/CFA65/VesB family protein
MKRLAAVATKIKGGTLMKKILFSSIVTLVVCSFLMIAAVGKSYSQGQYYTTGGCVNCHGVAAGSTSCIGCHAMGVHSSPVPGSAGNQTLNLVARTNRSVYLPGEPVPVTISGGSYGRGWAEISLYDENMTKLAEADSTLVLPDATAPCCQVTWGEGYPITLTGLASSVEGTYTWNAGWYGNQYDAYERSNGTKPTYFGPRWTPDPNNPNHGWEFISSNSFVVSSVPTPIAPSALMSAYFGNVPALSTSPTKTSYATNMGNADLHLTSIALCAGTSSEFSWTPQAPMTVAPGARLPIIVTYRPLNTGSDTGCLSVTTDDPNHPTITLSVSGTGTPPAVDMDIVSFTVTPSVSLRSKAPLAIQLSVINPGTISGTANAIVQGALNGTSVYYQSMVVSDVIGDTNPTVYTFPSYTPTAKGTITWTATISDTTSDVDTASAATTVSR